MNIQQAKSIRITDLLATLGHEPTHTTHAGNQVWYKSPLRAEKTASFTVKVSDNCWKDFGGSGGNILDLVMAYEQTDVRGALEFLDGLSLRTAEPIIRRIRKQNKDNTIILHKAKRLEYGVLLQQLQEKGIPADLAKFYLLEAHYSNGGKNYFGYAMPNDRGGFEIHNKLFKGATLKSPTTIEGTDRQRVTIFEGMTDFLSALQYHNILSFQTDVVVLHSLAFCTALIEKIQQGQQYHTAFMYLDNDAAGQEALRNFSEELKGITSVKPMNDFYSEYKDVNAFWKALKGR